MAGEEVEVIVEETADSDTQDADGNNPETESVDADVQLVNNCFLNLENDRKYCHQKCVCRR